MTEISDPVRQVVSVLQGQPPETLLQAARFTLALLEQAMDADASSEPAA